jgi:hypothetical protein
MQSRKSAADFITKKKHMREHVRQETQKNILTRQKVAANKGKIETKESAVTKVTAYFVSQPR